MESWKSDANSSNRGDVSNEERRAYIAALLRERRSCEIRGLTKRLPQIDRELRRIGYEAAAPAKRGERRPAANVEKR